MAMNPGGGGRGGTLSGINVTPMADVVIVLLIIFMVATSTFTRESTRGLPFAKNAVKKEAPQEAISVSVTRLRVAVDDLTFARPEEMLPLLQARLETAPEGHRLVLLKAEQDLSYSTVDRVVSVCRQAGMEQLAFTTAPAPPGESAKSAPVSVASKGR
jgi:biopolymer transport protein TolR